MTDNRKLYGVRVELSVSVTVPVLAQDARAAEAWCRENVDELRYNDEFDWANEDAYVVSASELVQESLSGDIAHRLPYGDDAPDETVFDILSGRTVEGWEAALVTAGWETDWFTRRRQKGSISDVGLISPCGRWAAAAGDLTHVPSGFCAPIHMPCPDALADLSQQMGGIGAQERTNVNAWSKKWSDGIKALPEWSPSP